MIYENDEEFLRAIKTYKETAEAIATMRVLSGDIREEDYKLAVESGMYNMSLGYVFNFDRSKWVQERKKDD